LNFADLVENDGFKKTIYYAALENVEFQSTLKKIVALLAIAI
jgi:hypothetical protein